MKERFRVTVEDLETGVATIFHGCESDPVVHGSTPNRDRPMTDVDLLVVWDSRCNDIEFIPPEDSRPGFWMDYITNRFRKYQDAIGKSDRPEI